MRPEDIRLAIRNNIEKDILTFSLRDQFSGYARWMAKWWNELPKEMTDEEARKYLGLEN